MNSELTRKLIERRIANNNEGIVAMDRDGISNHLQRELYDRWKQDNAIYEFALVGLSVQTRPIAEFVDAAEMSDAELEKLVALFDESYGGPYETHPIPRAWVRTFEKAGYLSPDQLAILSLKPAPTGWKLVPDTTLETDKDKP